MSIYTVALLGNPNCGKTTLFNALTGAHQKVGNWPGVTVEQKIGTFDLDELKIRLVDLPGIYSLEQEFLGLDEEIARNFIQSEEVDCIINIIDAGNLERNLVLTQQIMEQNKPLLVALNMIDVAQQQGIKVDEKALADNLGTEVIPIIASSGQGLDKLKLLLSSHISTKEPAIPTLALPDSPSSEKLIKRYHRSQQLVNGVVEVSRVTDNLTERIDRWVLNKWLGIPFFLLMMYIMFTVAVNMGAVFIDFFDILFGAIFVDATKWLLNNLGFPALMIVLISDGLGGGIQLVATFIPVIGFLFLCLSVLEGSGYMSRAAFVVDSLMSKLGLPGTAFVPLIVGFGCNVPSIMASRSLGRESDRLLTIAMAPFMSCGARLTVYALFAAAFFETNGQNIVFLLYLLGIVMAVLTGFIFRKQIFDTEITPSFQEMPAYHIPVLRNILITTWFRLRSFLFRAGKTIVLVVMALSFLNSLSFDGSFGNEDSEASVLSTIGKAITPAFAPIGIKEENWPATVGLFTGIFAKEAVVGTLDALYSRKKPTPSGAPDLIAVTGEALNSIWDNGSDLLSGLADPLGISIEENTDIVLAAEAQGVETGTLTNMALLFGDQFAAFCYLVFILLYAPCVAVLGAISKEAGWRWALLVFCWTTGLAYVTASNIYQIGTFNDHPQYSMLWVISTTSLTALFIVGLKQIGKKSLPVNLIQTVQID